MTPTRTGRTWAPGYYYVLFEDPDGIRLEVNFVPGSGVLADGTQFNPRRATSETLDQLFNGDGFFYDETRGSNTTEITTAHTCSSTPNASW